ncbi:Uu.00g103910.m01.CDS01 [Anthostomella pinea]|uniref:Uu.00g103910.m01.CDS01 n=1 Tax=Anthostomella pinea TaxID=933095 RepID=A0AAI8YFM8_9PEZI|nr:Uu.00g103910.m01.CDS01 [Anthostomella pinea]
MSQAPQQPNMPATGGAGGKPLRKGRDPTVPRNFNNPNNARGVKEEDLPPSAEANDAADTRDYVNSTDTTGPEDDDRQTGTDWSDGYYTNSNYTTSKK